jgi:hypothetical protein
VPIHHHPKGRDFLMIENATVRDRRLSFKARGVLAWLLSKPAGWEPTVERLADESPDGVFAIRSACKELEQHGYLARKRARGKAGEWVNTWHVYEVPPSAETAQLPGVETAAGPGAETAHPKKTVVKPKDTNPLLTQQADAIARDEWTRRTLKPVGGFPGFRARIVEALDAGATEEQLRKALPTMTTFTRGSFDFALGGGARKQPGKRRVNDGGEHTGPAGRVEL